MSIVFLGFEVCVFLLGVVPGAFCVLGSGFGVFNLISSFLPTTWTPPLGAVAGLGSNQAVLLWQKIFAFEVFGLWVWGSSFVLFFVLPTSPAQCPAVV